MTMTPDQHEIIATIISNYLRTTDTIWEPEGGKYIVQFQGRLRKDSMEAYDQLSKDLINHNFTPLFREGNNQDVIQLVAGVARPKPTNPWNNLILFILTFLSMLFTGAMNEYSGPADPSLSEWLWETILNIGQGIPFAVSLLAILFAHEFGHYLAARYHKTAVTLPYFIPLPIIGGFGTLGAYIRLKEPPKNKRVLLDIGIAGPLAGLVVAIPVVLYGLSLSPITTLDLAPGTGFNLEGNSIIYLLSKYIINGELLPAPMSYEGLNPILYWLRYYFTGLPIPIGGRDVLLHPIAWAGWAGLLVTALNLIPAGQLDGGHAIFVLIGKKTENIRPFVLMGLILLGFLYAGWWLWALIIYSLGRYHAEPLDQITPLDPTRKALAVLMILIFLLVFTPVPLRIV